MSDKDEIILEYETVIHGQKVMVKRYKAQASVENPYERLAEQAGTIE